jgi:hypothetical protein
MGLILGKGSRKFLGALSATLRERTRRKAEELDKRRYPTYTPWMCVRPTLSAAFEDSDLVSMTYTSGDLITDRSRLKQISRFLSAQGHLITKGMPVAFDEWPIMDDVESERPDAIAAFCEGRALLSSSKFLADLYPALVDFVVPQRRNRPSGFDSAFARGAVFRTFPKGSTGLLAGFQLAHAMGHQAALLLQSVDPIFDGGRFELVDYSVRNDRRTADHAFVSSVALAYMVVLSRSLYGSQGRPHIADEHVRGYDEYLPNAVAKAISSLRQVRLTEVGATAVSEIEQLAA